MESRKDQKNIDKNLKLIVKSSFVVFIGLLISKILTYIYRIIIARSFGPEVYGLFSISIMILGWFMLFASLGFSDGLIRYLALFRGKKQYNKIKHIFKITVFINLITGVLCSIFLFFLAEFISINIFHNSNLTLFLKIFSFIVPIYLFANIFLSVLQAFEKIQWYSFIINILQNAVNVFALIIFLLIGLKSEAIIFSYFLGIVSMLVVSYFIVKYKTPSIFGESYLIEKEKKEIKKEFISYSWPLMFMGITANLFFWADSFFIGYFKGVSAVGFYNAAIPIAFLLMFIPEIFLKLFFPLITKEYSKGKSELVKQLSQQVGKWIFILNLPLFLIMFLFPGVIINFLFGPQYLVAANALKILSVGAFFYSLVWIHNNLLSMIGKSKILFINIVGVSILNIFLDIFLIPKYGLNGAAISTTISKTILAGILFIEVKYSLKVVPFRRKIIPIFIISLIPVTITLILRKFVQINIFSLILIGLLFILIYILLIILTKSLDKNDLMILSNIKNKIFNYNHL